MPQQDYSPNATIITTPGGGRARPKNLISAVSEIQQFYVIESKGQEIPAEFLTLEGTLDFFGIGVSSGFKEGLILILLLPVFVFYLLPFVFHTDDLFLRIMLNTVPYSSVIVNTVLCIYISRYYIGNLTRKAVNSLFVGRAVTLVVKAGIIYISYYMLQSLSSPENVWAVVKHFRNAQGLYTDYFEILPSMMPLATECALIVLVSAIVPYGAVFVLDRWRRFKIDRNQKALGGNS